MVLPVHFAEDGTATAAHSFLHQFGMIAKEHNLEDLVGCCYQRAMSQTAFDSKVEPASDYSDKQPAAEWGTTHNPLDAVHIGIQTGEDYTQALATFDHTSFPRPSMALT